MRQPKSANPDLRVTTPLTTEPQFGPTGRRGISKIEQRERLAVVEELMLRGVATHRIKRAIREKFGAVPYTAIDKLVLRVRDRLAQEHEQNRTLWKHTAVERLYRNIQSAAQDRQWSAVASLERLLADIQGTREPVKIDVSIALANNMARMVASLTEEELTQMDQEYLELERRAALALPVHAEELNGTGGGNDQHH